MSRDDIVRLGRGGQPWDFLPAAVACLRVAPQDTEVRFLLAAALGRLGLRMLALDQLAIVEHTEPTHRAVASMRAALSQLVDDELTATQRIDLARANLAALGLRASDLESALPAWEAHARATQAYRTLDGNVVRRRAGDADPSRWLHLSDHAGAARAFVAQHIEGKPAPRPPVTIEGVDPPWLFAAIARATPRDATGLHARLVVLQADAIEALDGLSLVDLRDWLSAERVLMFAGAGASERLGMWAARNLGCRLSGPLVPLLGVRTRCEPSVASVLQAAIATQEARAAELRRAIADRDDQRPPSRLAERLAPWRGEAAPGPASDPVRVLIPTCRYTTFLQHAASDLRDAFERLGCRAEVLIEPDSSAQMSAVAYLEAVHRVDPDLIVTVNYTRGQLGDVLPSRVPIVCWVQDMMPHLFTRQSGLAQGPLDLLVGHCGEDLFTKYAYARDRAVASPVVASQTKFHPAPVDPALRERFACEIACVTHHSETVEAMHTRLKRESAADPDAAGVMEELLPACLDIATSAGDAHPWKLLESEVARVLARRHRHADNPDIAGAFLRSYAVPIADRAFRHQAIAWAAAIARRRGWRLRLYGKGWEFHPTLAEFAAGLTEHGEELRAAYQCAAVNLHLCLTTLMHQRPMECVLSGGLVALRPTRDALAPLNARAQVRLAQQGTPPTGIEPTTGLPLWTFDATPEGARYRDLIQRLGMTLRLPGTVLKPSRLEALRLRGLEPIENDPTWLFGDLWQVSFRDEATLEVLVDRALREPEWRASVSDDIASRVRERLTHTALARRTLAKLAAITAEQVSDTHAPHLATA